MMKFEPRPTCLVSRACKSHLAFYIDLLLSEVINQAGPKAGK